jgi:ubiquitin-conjugating enzyme E2 Q
VETQRDYNAYAASSTPAPKPGFQPAKMAIYNQNFDDMTDVSKAETIVMLIETLPSIKDLRTFLMQQTRSSEPSLRAWNDRVSPAALGMLRWIIASNRSCIVQVDRCPGQDDAELAKAKVRLEQRISNMSSSWVQFRFAQGAPDKEQRFLKALKQEQGDLNSKHPTLFAWHGSPLQNWHSIIRSGLDFKETAHGRAYGHGVYHAMDQATSQGYAQHNAVSYSHKI